MTFPYSEQNAQSRRRLETLIHRLSDEELARSTNYGWTIAALLAHLAFWDQRVLVILRRWKEQGFDPSPIDSAAATETQFRMNRSLHRDGHLNDIEVLLHQ